MMLLHPILLLTAVMLLLGCATTVPSSNPYAPATASARDVRRADALNLEAMTVVEDDEQKAESLLREALTADLYHGPAHNNLGVLYLRQGKLYEAAHEFEWSRKLLPGHPDPRMNLAITLERAGRVDEALAAYESALEVYPGHIGTLQGLTRLQLRRGLSDSQTLGHLQEIALRGDTDAWRNWAQRQISRSEPGDVPN